MTPIPYQLTATSGSDGKFSATLTYGSTAVATASDLSERHVERWARTAAKAHKDSISPAETQAKETVIRHTIVP